jgi:ribosome-associated protein
LSDNTLRINDNLTIPRDELRFRYARSSGPGGQKVNRTASQVELLFDVAHSPSLTPRQRALIQHRMGGYIDSRGVLHLVSSATPSQWRNREEVIARFRALLLHSLRVRRRRIPTRPSKAVKEKRLQRKKRRSQTKRQRRRTEAEEW